MRWIAQCLVSFVALSLVGVALAEVPRPEHPRPDLLRSDWINLNGTWEFGETDDGKDQSFLTKSTYPDKIVVPFCRESKLSGLGRTGFVKNVWYRRSFEIPASWRSERTILHIGACDWHTTVWVNGERVGEHVGGNVAFGFDISRYLKAGENTLIIHALDDTLSGIQALGKQARTPQSEGIFYTRTTGIWQTVWLERVGTAYTKDLRIEPDYDADRFQVTVGVDGATKGMTVRVLCEAEGKKVAESVIPAERRDAIAILPVGMSRAWSPRDPFLYDFTIQVLQEGKVIDEVKSYAGMRKVSIDGRRILLNNKPVFQRLVLDQGFYPDGVWTAPSDQALKGDIAMSMAVGFNGARLHQKVFEPRFLYWADKLGYLVWGEFPNYGMNNKDARGERPVMEEWNAIVARDRNHPSIIGWCPFNETPPEAGPLQNSVVRMTWQLDPSRPVIDTSGWTHSLPEAEVMDAHDYDQNPASFRERWIKYFGQGFDLPTRYCSSASRNLPFMISEFGGIGWNTGTGWGYGNPPKTLDEFYARLDGLVSALTDNANMFGYCYTQLTDVEQERNGIFQFDRKPKFDQAKLKAILGRPAAYEKGSPPLSAMPVMDFAVLVGSARDSGLAKPWRSTTQQPAATWNQATFDDSKWKSAPGGFGNKEGYEKDIQTEWKTSDIWLRQAFDWDGKSFDQALLAIHFDNAIEVFINGTEVWRSARGGWNDGYEGMDITDAVRKALKKGSNLIAVHCHQDTGGQFIDLALLLAAKK
ncbi:MAG: hypothetical protein K1X67_07055 [Fimbriimonadaceae bacterium]|nr:hypothetical protein [Fimbriimonadaceae bacterium]